MKSINVEIAEGIATVTLEDVFFDVLVWIVRLHKLLEDG